MRAKLKHDAESSRGSFVDAKEEESKCKLCEREGRHFPFFFHIAESEAQHAFCNVKEKVVW